ncbi:hypothetical protein PLESTB_001312500 [Pleodorina starrii]|uniref:Uncharacterized protein n=1 Tax=Pleodorina starrii TaxID=330485 RepID=A0A9W6F6F4_9CHLO|nr:hypothetical protein PLESTB_001312500 [Pleodorina starrii]
MTTSLRSCLSTCGVSGRRHETLIHRHMTVTTVCVPNCSFTRRDVLSHGLQPVSSHIRRPSQNKWVVRAGAMDAMPAWTLDQIAGLVFGAIMLASVLSARQVDVAVAKAQRRQLGLCEECGGVYEPGTCQQGNCPAKRGGQAR